MSGPNGVTGILRAYSAGQIDRRTVLGQWITQRENQLTRHCGYDKQPPVTLAGKIHLVIRQELFLALFDSDDSERSLQALAASKTHSAGCIASLD